MTEEGRIDLKVSDETEKQIDELLARLGKTMGSSSPNVIKGLILEDRVENKLNSNLPVAAQIITETTELRGDNGGGHVISKKKSLETTPYAPLIRIWTVINGGLYEVDFNGIVVP